MITGTFRLPTQHSVRDRQLQGQWQCTCVSAFRRYHRYPLERVSIPSNRVRTWLGDLHPLFHLVLAQKCSLNCIDPTISVRHVTGHLPRLYHASHLLRPSNSGSQRDKDESGEESRLTGTGNVKRRLTELTSVYT
jgi:hypothetical protein